MIGMFSMIKTVESVWQNEEDHTSLLPLLLPAVSHLKIDTIKGIRAMFAASITTSKTERRMCLTITITGVEFQSRAVEIIALKFQLLKTRQPIFCLGKEWRLMYLKREWVDHLDLLSMCRQSQVMCSIKIVNCRLNSTDELAMDADSENENVKEAVEVEKGVVNM